MIKSNKILTSIIILIALFIFDQFVTKIFALNLDYGGMASSDTKKEAIKRGTYLYDVLLPYSRYKINDSMEIEIKEGWVEKCWRTGSLNWSTNIDERCGYTISIITTKKDKKYKTWMLKQKRTGKYSGYSTLCGYRYEDARFHDRVDELPKDDTLHFYAVTEHNAHFNDSTDNTYVLGELKLVIMRK